MIDKRKCFRMENGYCSSDFTFYKKYPESAEGHQYAVYKYQEQAGNSNWWLKETYTYISKSTSGFREQVLVLTNDAGIQIETAGFGWYRVITEHDKALKERKDYEKFLTALGDLGKVCPVSCSRWFSDMLEHFTYTHEETLSYGDEE